jgi:2-keto-4-pentenoate hydratase/2-oxohepta-3-ene-1,7-dioic acid hydratase in catechol pathway
MRIATIALDGSSSAAVVDGDRALELAGASSGLESVREIAAGGQRALDRVGEWAVRQRDEAWRPIAGLRLGPAVPDPGAIYTIGLNYGEPGEPAAARPPRPLIYGKAPTSVVGPGAVISWDRTLTSNVDAEVELGIVIGETAFDISPNEALRHVFGYTCINDISSRDLWLDGDQWLLGKSMPGFCPVGPWVVTRDELDPLDLRLGCTINGSPIQDGRTSGMRFSIPEIVAFLSRHAVLRPGDLIATGTPARLATPPGPDRRLQPGDIVTVSIERIGELTTTIG